METLASATVSNPYQILTLTNKTTLFHFQRFGFQSKPKTSKCQSQALVGASGHTHTHTHTHQEKKEEEEEGKRRFKWARIGPNVTEAQKKAICELSPKMTKRCKAVMGQIICFSDEKATLSELLAEWVRLMKPRRADWLVVLKHLKNMNHPLYLQAAEIALLQESFEANIRDYTKIIHAYGKQNRVNDAKSLLNTMKSRGLICDQVILTTFIDMYSKVGDLHSAEEYFEEVKLLGEPLDKRSCGAMVMAYIRAGMLGQAEGLLREMDSQEIYAGSEVFKALLRAYSMAGNVEGAQRAFDVIQLARITLDAKLCGLLINAYAVSGQSENARSAFENMRRAGLEPSDKCVALVLLGYEKEDKLQRALEFLIELERDGGTIGKEASETLVGWFRKLGVVKEVDLVLREFADLKKGRYSKVRM